MAAPNIQITIDHNGPITIARIAGELSGLAVEEFTETVSEHASGDEAKLAIDLSGVKLIDSSGLGALIQAVTRSRLSQGRVVLVAPSPFVSGILNVTRLDQWFEVAADHEEAQRRLTEA